jgi:5-methylcytosine-specific restriction endonuclease McrA
MRGLSITDSPTTNSFLAVDDGINIQAEVDNMIRQWENPSVKTIIKSIKKIKKSIYPSLFRKKQRILKSCRGCSKCGSERYLQVHHIDKNKFNNSDDNLKLLCYNCHKEIHKHLCLPTFIAKFG